MSAKHLSSNWPPLVLGLDIMVIHGGYFMDIFQMSVGGASLFIFSQISFYRCDLTCNSRDKKKS